MEIKDQSEALDMRVHVPIKRHTKLIQLFKELSVGDNFIFINDHDPIPLYYEFLSIYGDVVGWEYLNRGGREWTVKVTRTEASQGREFEDIATLLDLRKANKNEWKQIVFHRFGMMEEGAIMEIIAAEEPKEIHSIFVNKFKDQHSWTYKKQNADEVVVHITKKVGNELGDDGYSVVNEFDLRPFPPSQRHEMFYKAFADITAGEAFEFINDHDPLPLYYQMKVESKDPFQWKYLIKGPEAWKVRVIKTK